MSWKVVALEEAAIFLRGLPKADRAKVDARIRLLEELGPSLGRPAADSVNGSRHSNMKELRIKLGTKEYRILYAFDPTRTGILLIGGDKVGDKDWYGTFITKADNLFDVHLATLKPSKTGKKRR